MYDLVSWFLTLKNGRWPRKFAEQVPSTPARRFLSDGQRAPVAPVFLS
jgi:hypothetical protein